MTASLHTAILSLGANIPGAPEAVGRAIARLAGLCTVLARSAIYTTPAVGARAGIAPDYANAVAEIATTMTAGDLSAALKHMEAEAGRSHGDSLVALDIDVVIYDGTTMRPADAARSYFIIGYNQIRNASTP